jgi:hypothetical protein
MPSANSIYVKGHSHSVCQDYARGGSLRYCGEDVFYGIISDGCSSSPDTDIGARSLVLEAERLLNNDGRLLNLECVVNNCYEHITTYPNLSNLCLDATLFAMYTLPHDIRVHMSGDGIFVARHRGTQKFDVIRVRFPNGAPWYLSYSLDKNRFGALMNERLCVQKEYFFLDIKTRTTEHRETFCTTITPQNSRGFFVDDMIYRLKDLYDLYLIMSDGVESFVHKKTRVSIPFEVVLYELLSFKNFNGTEWLTRRVKRAIAEFEKQDLIHDDDISIAAIYLGE